MKFSTALLMMMVVVVAVAMVSAHGAGPGSKAERRAHKKAEKQAARRMLRKNCKYNKLEAVCDESMTPPKRIAQLIPEESQDPANCPPTIMLPCRNNKMRCRYNLKERKTAVCNEDTQKMTITLKSGDSSCPSTKEINCPKGNRGSNRRRKVNGEKCIYNKRGATCDEATQMKTLTLKRGGASCPQTKEVSCLKCKYNWKEAKTAVCNEQTQTKIISLKKGESGCPETKEIPCEKGMKGGRRGKNRMNKL